MSYKFTAVFLLFIFMLAGCPSKSKTILKNNRENVLYKNRISGKKLRRAPRPCAELTSGQNIPLPSSIFNKIARGPRDAPIKIVEFYNPLSKERTVYFLLRKKLLAKYSKHIHWNVIFSPVPMLDRGYHLSRLMVTAAELGFFWNFLEKIEKNISKISKIPLDKTLKILFKHPLKRQLFFNYYNSSRVKNTLDFHLEIAFRLKLSGKNALWLNGRLFRKLPPQKLLLSQLECLISSKKKYKYQGSMFEKFTSFRSNHPVSLPNYINSREYIELPPSVWEGIPFDGPGDAPIRILAFIDFSSEQSRKLYFTLKKLKKDYKEKVTLYIRYLVTGSKESKTLASLASMALEVRYFWPIYRLLFEGGKSAQNRAIGKLKERGFLFPWGRLGLETGLYLRHPLKNNELLQRLGFGVIPALIVNGVKLSGFIPYFKLKEIIEIELWKMGILKGDRD